jgi:hypothetical protein
MHRPTHDMMLSLPEHAQPWQGWDVLNAAAQILPTPFAFLSATGASSGQTSVHAVEEPWLPLGNLTAGVAELQCAVKGGNPLTKAPHSRWVLV